MNLQKTARHLLGALLLVLLAWQALLSLGCNYYCAIQLPRLMAQFTPILKWPMGIIYIIMMIGLLLLTLYSFYLSLSALLRGDTKAQKKEKTAAEIAEEVE